MFRLCPEELRTGEERRAFLTDPSHKHVFILRPSMDRG